MRKIKWILVVVSALWMAGCKPDEVIEVLPSATGAKVVFDLRYNDQPFAVGDIYYDNFGHRIRIDNFMSYISMMKLVKDDDTEVLLNDFYLANFSHANSLSFELPAGHFKALSFGIGVPHDFNKDQDPTVYPNNHPLSVPGSEGMFWGWNSGYIFVKFEGKADTLGIEGEPLIHPFAFHIGDDPFYRTHTAEGLNITIEEGKISTIRIIIAVDKILFGDNDQIDLATDYLTHTSDNIELATKFVDNFDASISVE